MWGLVFEANFQGFGGGLVAGGMLNLTFLDFKNR